MLHGRAAERARLDLLVAGAAAARGGALVVGGEPGAGKTALLTDAADRAVGAAVLRTSGIESESPLAFAALHRLLRPVLDRLPRIPPGQAAALRRALGGDSDDGTGPGGGDDRFVVFVATLSLLAELGEEQPVLCVVDDAHWLDAASAEALLFVARRLAADRVVLLFGVRDGEPGLFAAHGLPQLSLAGLDAAAAAAVIADHAPVPMAAAVRDQLTVRTGGNPLALVELPGVLSGAQLAGRVPLPDQLPLTAGVERAFLDRTRHLSDGAQALLLVAAADDSGRLSVIRQAAADLGADDESLDAAEASGLFRVRADDVTLRHPLVRSAVYAAATTSRRQQAHRALSAALGAAGDVDRATWHAATATSGLDDGVAHDLDSVAERASRRGGHEAASAASDRAAALSGTPDARAPRLYAAASSAWLAGDGARAGSLAEAARHVSVDTVLSADVESLRGRMEWHIGSPQLGRRIILRGALDVAGIDPARALQMRMQATALATWGTGVSADDDLDFSAPAVDDAAPPRLRCLSALVDGHRHFLRGNLAAAAAAWRAAFALAAHLPHDPDLLVNLGIAGMHLGDSDVVRSSYEELLTTARETGAATTTVHALSRLPGSLMQAGEWSAAAAAANEALVLARGIGQVSLTTMPLAWTAVIGALRGEDGAVDALEELAAILGERPMGIVGVAAADMAEWTRGVLATTAGETDAALHHLGRIRHATIARAAAFDRIEAAHRAGRSDLIRGWADELSAFAAVVDVPWPAAAAEHGRALISAGEAAEQHFGTAMELHGRSRRPFPQARTELAYGEYLRRNRRRVDARSHLTDALQVFGDLRAQPWAERARQELRASGVTARKRDVTTTVDLTPQERQAALLVRAGLGNREIAARLFLSPRTVEYHLSNAYQKLGVRSRGELAQIALS